MYQQLRAVENWNSDKALPAVGEAKAAIRAMLQSSDTLESIEGKRVKVFWPGDAHWYPATAGPTDTKSGPRLTRIDYDDGETYRHDLSEAAWRVLTN